MTILKGNIFIEGPAGQLEAILKQPTGPVTRTAIVCHPHPLFGGTMHNKVAYRIAKAFEHAGFAVARFNFRGAGRSHGAHDEGRGEQDDLRAVIHFMEQKYPGSELWLGGFSFGSSVMLRVGCGDARARALVAVGAPVSKYDFSYLASCDKPKLFVQGSRDEFGSVEDLKTLIERIKQPRRMKVIDDADHFFEGHLDELGRAVSEFISSIEADN